MKQDEWTLRCFNASDNVIGSDTDYPIQPGGLISGLIFYNEKLARRWLDNWAEGARSYPILVKLYLNGDILETYTFDKRRKGNK